MSYLPESIVKTGSLIQRKVLQSGLVVCTLMQKDKQKDGTESTYYYDLKFSKNGVKCPEFEEGKKSQWATVKGRHQKQPDLKGVVRDVIWVDDVIVESFQDWKAKKDAYVQQSKQASSSVEQQQPDSDLPF